MSETATTSGGLLQIHRRLYFWVLQLARHTHAQFALFAVALAEASFFPIPPDVLLLAMVVARPDRAIRFAALASLGSVVGGAVGYGIGWAIWEGVQDWFFRYVPGFDPEIYARVSGLYEEHSFWIVFTAGFTPIPYKVFTIAAGVAQIQLGVFLIASLLSRSARFFLVALLVAKLGPRVQPWIEKRLGWLSILFVVLLAGGFYLLKWLH